MLNNWTLFHLKNIENYGVHIFSKVQDIVIEISYMLVHKTKTTNAKELKSCILFLLSIVELS